MLLFAHHFDSEAERTTLSEIQHLAVSADGAAVAIVDSNNTALIVPLDLYFHLFPQCIYSATSTMIASESNEGEDEIVAGEEDNGTLEYGCSSWRHVLHGRNIVQPRQLHPYERLRWYQWAVKDGALRQTTSIVAPWTYDAIRSAELLPTTAHAAVLPVVFRCNDDFGTVARVLITSDALTLVGDSGQICSFERTTKTIALHNLSNAPILPVVLADQSLLVLQADKLLFMLRNMSVAEFLDHVIMTEGGEYVLVDM